MIELSEKKEPNRRPPTPAMCHPSGVCVPLAPCLLELSRSRREGWVSVGRPGRWHDELTGKRCVRIEATPTP